MYAPSTNLYEFGPFRLDPALPLLLRGGEPVALPPKALETLVALVERGGRVVSREELIETVWPDVEVEENNLSVNVSILRKALGEANGGEKYIETVPRRGYCFTAPVRGITVESPELIYTRHTRSQILIEESHERDAPSATAAPASVLDVTPETSLARAAMTSNARSNRQLENLTRWPFVLTIVAVVAALAAGAGLVRRASLRGDASASDRRGAAAVNAAGIGAVRTLAVLPFRNVAVRDYEARNVSAAGELTDAVMARLGASGNVNLTPTSAVLAEKMTPNNMLLAGRALQTDAVLTGALFKSDPEEVYLRLHLVGVSGGEVLWAETFKHTRGELPSLLDSIARGVEEGLHRLASAEEYEQRASRHTMSRDAYQLYLQGRFLWEQRHDVFNPSSSTEGETVASINQLEQAIALDPNFALAYVGLADHYKTTDYNSPKRRRGDEYVQKAIALDPSLAEAHATLGFVRMFQHWDWDGAEAEFRRALELDTNCVTAHQWYALFHALRGNKLEAFREIARARELAPYSLSIAIDEAEMKFYARQPGPVVDKLRRALALHPNSEQIRGSLVNAYWLYSKYELTPELVEKALELAEWKGSPQDFARLWAGPRKGSRDFNNIRPGQSYWYARGRAQLGQREEALDLLERAYREHDFFIIYLKAEPFFDPLRDEPRFQELLRKVGLAE
ncbi:MAG: winged helix-turn-helix domain-containing protein [Rubrivivax sp.]|nr:winged helix-turn-helix domain-containing protein [Pyrinomonadaceae bacterium]